MYKTQILKSTVACAFVLGAASLASTAMAQSSGMSGDSSQMSQQQQKTMAMMQKKGFGKCYGVNAAFKNDCKSPGHSCAGQDSKANDANAFVAMPSGVCTKLSGGSTTAG